MQIHAAIHSCWLASFLAFCLGGRPAIYTIYIPYISLIYSIYTYNYMHIWRAARNVKITPANNYAAINTSHITARPFAHNSADENTPLVKEPSHIPKLGIQVSPAPVQSEFSVHAKPEHLPEASTHVVPQRGVRSESSVLRS